MNRGRVVTTVETFFNQKQPPAGRINGDTPNSAAGLPRSITKQHTKRHAPFPRQPHSVPPLLPILTERHPADNLSPLQTAWPESGWRLSSGDRELAITFPDNRG